MTRVRAAASSDSAAWRQLWTEYNRFYKANVPAAVTDATWRRMLDPASTLIGRVAERDGAVVGFSISIVHACTWTIAPVCYLEDLFVDSQIRGGGIGSALIQDLVDLARKKNWSRLYWHTRADNIAARRLYDRFAKADDFVRYRLFFE